MTPEVTSTKKHLAAAGSSAANAATNTAATGFEAVKEGASEAFETGRKALSHAIESVPEAAKSVYGEVEGAVDGFLSSASKQIRRKPIQSLLIGLGVGAVIGLLLRGRAND